MLEFDEYGPASASFSTATWIHERIDGDFPPISDIISRARDARCPPCSGRSGCTIAGMMVSESTTARSPVKVERAVAAVEGNPYRSQALTI